MRTIVIADAHGYPWLIENALRHAEFDPDVDRFIFGGDFLDRGPDPQGCVELIERFATEVIVGNHELAVLLEDPITPFDPESARFEPYLRERVIEAPQGERWTCAVEVGDVLVTHAGLSVHYEDLFAESGGDVAALAATLNTLFAEELRASVSRWAVHWKGLLGLRGPFWFRPRPERAADVLSGITQVAGHTPVDEAGARRLAAIGLYLVEPGVYVPPAPDRYRYAVIDEDGVRLVDSEFGTLEV